MGVNRGYFGAARSLLLNVAAAALMVGRRSSAGLAAPCESIRRL